MNLQNKPTLSAAQALLMPPEWDERFDGVILAWPHAGTDWADMLAEVCDCYRRLVQALLQAGCKVAIVTPEPEAVKAQLSEINVAATDAAVCSASASLGADAKTTDAACGQVMLLKIPTNDTWTRDYAPIPVQRADGSLAAVSYGFNGWGLKFAADKDNLVALRLDLSGLDVPNIVRKNYILEGGSVESDGRGTILTTSKCMLSVNRNGLTDKQRVERELAEGLGASRVLWLDYGAIPGDDTDSHIDTLARFAPHDTILYVKCYDTANPAAPELAKMEAQLSAFRTAEGMPYNLIGLPMPDPLYDEEGDPMPATYANFLITPRAVLMPQYGQPRNDQLASQMLSIAFPDHKIIGVDCRALIRQHGSLHCATMQFPSRWGRFGHC